MLRYLRENTGNWIIKIFLGIIVIVFVFLGVGSMNATKQDEVATVNEEAITLQEFQDTYRMLVQRMRTQFGDNLNDEILNALNVKQQALNSLVEQKLLDIEASKLNILVSDKELQDSLLAIKAFHVDGVFDMAQYKKVLGLNSMTPEGFEILQRRAMKEQKLREMILSGVTVSDVEAKNWYLFQNTKMEVEYIKVDPASYTNILPTQEQISQEYEKSKAQYLSEPKRKAVYLKFAPKDHKGKAVVSQAQVEAFYEQNIDRFKTPEKVEAAHILIKVDENAGQELVDSAQKQAMDVYEKAAGGEDFSDLAKEFSQGPSKDSGGYLGVFERAAMVKPFGDAVFAMESGGISQPVRTRFGWHVIKLMARFDASVETLEDAREKIKAELEVLELQNMAYYQAGEAFDSVVDGDDLEQVALVAGKKIMGTELFTQDGRGLEIENADAFAREAFGLTQGDISDVKQLGDAYYLIKVVEATVPEQLGLDQVKDEISEVLTARLRKEAAAGEAQKLAQKGADAGSITGLASAPPEVAPLFTRNQAVEGVGNSDQFTEAAFGLDKDNPVHPEAIEVGQAYYIIGFKERQVPSDIDAENNLEQVKKQIFSTKQSRYYAAWMDTLRNNAEIKVNSEIFN